MIKKINKWAVVLSMSLLASVGFAQEQYHIMGKVAGFDQPSMAYLYNFNNGRNLLDSAAVVNGSFSFKGTVKHPLSVSIQIKKIRKSVSLFLENEDYNILMYPNWKNKDSIRGGSEMKIQKAFEAETAALNQQMQELGRRYEKLGKEERIKEGEEMNAIYEKEMGIKYKYIRKYPASLAMLHIMRPSFDVMNLKELEEMKTLFSPRLAYSDVYSNLIQKYNQKKGESLVGQQAPDFSGQDLTGKTITLSNLKGKYVVVDFWASWCTPCRAANQKIKPIYEKYKNKGFEMISVSMDDKKNLWEAAVKKDGLPWLQTSELTGIERSSIAKQYHVRSLPTVFLLDNTGKVIAQNISERELEGILHTSLK